MDLVPNNVGSAAIRRQTAPSPCCILISDMLLGAEGQRVLEKFHYGSATKNQPFKRWRPERGLTTEKYEKEVVYWESS